jgi:methionine-rich copper-binding protein CopC
MALLVCKPGAVLDLRRYLAMKRFTALLALCVIGVAHAHAHLLRATPADGSVLTQAPASFVFEFNEAATLTSLTLQKDSQASQKIGALPAKPSAQFSIPAPKLDPGSYTLSYRVLSDDNHVMSGTIRFRVSAEK